MRGRSGAKPPRRERILAAATPPTEPIPGGGEGGCRRPNSPSARSSPRTTSRNARVLGESVRRHHPDARMFVLLVDRLDGHFAPDREPFELIRLEELDIP